MKKKIKTFKYPYEFLISEDFLSKKNLENFFYLIILLKKNLKMYKEGLIIKIYQAKEIYLDLLKIIK